MHSYKHKVPQRIVSLVPSQTELLYSLGLDKEVAGITKFCVHPDEWFRNKQRIGGTKTINIQKILLLQPDLVIANKEENVKEQVEEIARHVPVYVTDIGNLEDALEMIRDIGEITNTAVKASQIIDTISAKFKALNDQLPQRTLKCAYLIWKDPYMTIGNDTFIHNMLHYCGFANAFSHLARYPEISIQDLVQQHCEYVLLSSEPYPFKEKHIDELQAVLPNAKIILVDGEMFSWYGSRLIEAPDYFKKIIEQEKLFR